MKTLKAFCIDESVRLGIQPKSVHMRIQRGHYYGTGLHRRRKNSRVVFVTRTIDL